MKMNNISAQSILTGIIFALNAHIIFADSQQLVTTDTSSCTSESSVISVQDGTSQEVIDASLSAWQALGFSIGPIVPDQDIITCTRDIPDPNKVETPEQEGLDQSASITTLAIDASIIQTNNFFTRLEMLREQYVPAALVEDSKEHRDESGGGASADGVSLLDQRLNVFVIGTGNIGDQQVTQRTNGFDFDTAGVTLGSDFRFSEQLIMGAAFGYIGSHTNMNKEIGNLDADNYNLSLFGSYSLPSNFYIDALARVGWSKYDSRRNFSTLENPDVIENVAAKYNGNDYSFSLSVGYSYNINALNLRPFLRYDYIHVAIDGYQEAGNASNLSTVESQHINSMRSALGAELSYAISTPYAVLIPLLRAEWQHEFMNDSRLLTAYQSNSPNIITQLYTDSPDRDFVNLGVGVSAVFAHGISGFFYYEAMLANRFINAHAFNGGIRMEF